MLRRNDFDVGQWQLSGVHARNQQKSYEDNQARKKTHPLDRCSRCGKCVALAACRECAGYCALALALLVEREGQKKKIRDRAGLDRGQGAPMAEGKARSFVLLLRITAAHSFRRGATTTIARAARQVLSPHTTVVGIATCSNTLHATAPWKGVVYKWVVQVGTQGNKTEYGRTGLLTA